MSLGMSSKVITTLKGTWWRLLNRHETVVQATPSDSSPPTLPSEIRGLSDGLSQVAITETSTYNVEGPEEANASQSPLLRLPSEVRNLIYEYALAGGTRIIDFDEGVCCRAAAKIPKVCHPAIIHVCRQVRSEALPIFYGITTFHFNSRITCNIAAHASKELNRAASATLVENLSLIKCFEFNIGMEYCGSCECKLDITQGLGGGMKLAVLLDPGTRRAPSTSTRMERGRRELNVEEREGVAAVLKEVAQERGEHTTLILDDLTKVIEALEVLNLRPY